MDATVTDQVSLSFDPAVWRATGAPFLAAGAAEGPLAGVRVAVKDLFAVAGQRVGGGNPVWLEQAPPEPEHASAVGQLLDSGASVAGLAHTDELAFSLAGTNVHYGTPGNPAAPGRTTGGSSSGCAAAVAGGAADLGLATDTAGSIRVPASYCGLYGWRPTHGSIPTDGLVALAPSFDTVGLLARTAGVLRAGARALLPESATVPVRRLVVDDAVTAQAGPEVATAFETAVRALSSRTGLDVVRVDSGVAAGVTEWLPAFRTVQAAEAWHSHGAWIERHPGALGRDVAARFEAGRTVGDRELARCRRVLDSARTTLLAEVPPGTALLLPSASSPAPRAEAGAEAIEATRAATLRLTCPASLAGLPAVGMPLLRVGGLPVGLCAVGAPGADHALLALAGT
ncbi:amidase [Streptomyces sp. cg35]|uniref:amidase n=1 Tax=Streptomyces sp. cg35 TaxID=3421650 RepID=UPI003D16A7FB